MWKKYPKPPAVPMRWTQRVGDVSPTPLFELLEKVSGTSKEVFWLKPSRLGAYVLPSWGIPVSSAASPRPEGAAIGYR